MPADSFSKRLAFGPETWALWLHVWDDPKLRNYYFHLEVPTASLQITLRRLSGSWLFYCRRKSISFLFVGSCLAVQLYKPSLLSSPIAIAMETRFSWQILYCKGCRILPYGQETQQNTNKASRACACLFTSGHQACFLCPGGSCICPGSVTHSKLVATPHYFCFGYRRRNEPGHVLSLQVWELQIGVSEHLFPLCVDLFYYLFCCFSFQGELTNGRSKFHVLFLLFVAVMFFVSLMFLFGYHCWLVSRNRSTLGKALVSCFSK